MTSVLFAAAVFAGTLGQSQPSDVEPIAWFDCSWCADDGEGNVYLPDGWMIPAGTTSPVRSARTVRPKPALTGVPPDVAGFAWGGNVLAKGRLPKSGDYVFSTKWPDSKVHRVTANGREIVDGFWPRKVYAESFAVCDGDLWALAGTAVRLSERLRTGRGAVVGDSGDNRVRGIARGRNGWWLATTQGAHYHPDDGCGLYPHRVGGMAQPTALALSRGRVVAVLGCRIVQFDLDDRADEAVRSAQTEWNWFVGASWGTKVDGIEAKDGVFLMHDAVKNETWRYDSNVSDGDYVRRGERMKRVDAAVTARTRGGEIGGHQATAIASDGEWTVAYVPARRAILKFRAPKASSQAEEIDLSGGL